MWIRPARTRSPPAALADAYWEQDRQVFESGEHQSGQHQFTQLDGEVRVTVRDESGTVRAMHREPIAVLSPPQWQAEPIALGLELLAAHVQPQSTALTAVLQDASYLLRLKTGREVLDGYQSDDPTHIDAMVEAIFEALRARGIRAAAQVGFGTWLGLLVGTLAKVALAVAMLGVFIVGFFF